MSEARDPAIKLFGSTIPVPEALSLENRFEEATTDEDSPSCIAIDRHEKESPGRGGRTKKQLINESLEPCLQKTALKKPDKLLPCPRCNSLDTKFCYYNNYNVNQPRHFCKNCQRYWTAGGSMRNVPVGAGRRKSKHAASQLNHHNPPEEQPDLSQIQPPRPEGASLLKFGTELPLYESMASLLHLGNQKAWAEVPWTGSHPALGKHCRDLAQLVEEKKEEKSLWVPKTLRIVDPGEAAKSSYWSTLGIKPEPGERMNKDGIFKGFQAKMGGVDLRRERDSMLQINPAALSRSQTFQEST